MNLNKTNVYITELLPPIPTDVDTYIHWKTKFIEVLDKHLSIMKMRVRKIDVSYMNIEWKNLIRKKRKYAKKFSKDKSEESWELMRK